MASRNLQLHSGVDLAVAAVVAEEASAAVVVGLEDALPAEVDNSGRPHLQTTRVEGGRGADSVM
jgi:hypothetical protein